MDFFTRGFTMIVATRNDSTAVLQDLVRQFGAGELSYVELWKEIEESFHTADVEPMPCNHISDASVGSGI